MTALFYRGGGFEREGKGKSSTNAEPYFKSEFWSLSLSLSLSGQRERHNVEICFVKLLGFFRENRRNTTIAFGIAPEGITLLQHLLEGWERARLHARLAGWRAADSTAAGRCYSTGCGTSRRLARSAKRHPPTRELANTGTSPWSCGRRRGRAVPRRGGERRRPLAAPR